MLGSVHSYGCGKAKLWQANETALHCASTSLLMWVAHSDNSELESDFCKLSSKLDPDPSQEPVRCWELELELRSWEKKKKEFGVLTTLDKTHYPAFFLIMWFFIGVISCSVSPHKGRLFQAFEQSTDVLVTLVRTVSIFFFNGDNFNKNLSNISIFVN